MCIVLNKGADGQYHSIFYSDLAPQDYATNYHSFSQHINNFLAQNGFDKLPKNEAQFRNTHSMWADGFCADSFETFMDKIATNPDISLDFKNNKDLQDLINADNDLNTKNGNGGNQAQKNANLRHRSIAKLAKYEFDMWQWQKDNGYNPVHFMENRFTITKPGKDTVKDLTGMKRHVLLTELNADTNKRTLYKFFKKLSVYYTKQIEGEASKNTMKAILDKITEMSLSDILYTQGMKQNFAKFFLQNKDCASQIEAITTFLGANKHHKTSQHYKKFVEIWTQLIDTPYKETKGSDGIDKDEKTKKKPKLIDLSSESEGTSLSSDSDSPDETPEKTKKKETDDDLEEEHKFGKSNWKKKYNANDKLEICAVNLSLMGIKNTQIIEMMQGHCPTLSAPQVRNAKKVANQIGNEINNKLFNSREDNEENFRFPRNYKGIGVVFDNCHKGENTWIMPVTYVDPNGTAGKKGIKAGYKLSISPDALENFYGTSSEEITESHVVHFVRTVGIDASSVVAIDKNNKALPIKVGTATYSIEKNNIKPFNFDTRIDLNLPEPSPAPESHKKPFRDPHRSHEGALVDL